MQKVYSGSGDNVGKDKNQIFDQPPLSLTNYLDNSNCICYAQFSFTNKSMKVTQKTIKNTQLYKQDFYLWIVSTTDLLRTSQFDLLDCESLIEEIESMGRSEKHSLASNLRVVLMHLLKYKYQPEKRSNSWLYTIFEHRERIKESLEDSPSLNPYLREIFDKCYNAAGKEASLETGLPLSTFPATSPFTLEAVLNQDFLE